MTPDLLQRLDNCISAFDTQQQQQNAGAVRAYVRGLDRRLARLTLLMESINLREGVERYYPVNQWIARICSMISEESLLQCDPRLDQSIDDLLHLLTAMDTP